MSWFTRRWETFAISGVTVLVMGIYFGWDGAQNAAVTGTTLGALEQGERPATRHVELTGGFILGDHTLELTGDRESLYYLPYCASPRPEARCRVLLRFYSSEHFERVRGLIDAHRTDAHAGIRFVGDQLFVRGELQAASLGLSGGRALTQAGLMAPEYSALTVGSDPNDAADLTPWFIGIGLVLSALGALGFRLSRAG